jgi:hypothetical protein
MEGSTRVEKRSKKAWIEAEFDNPSTELDNEDPRWMDYTILTSKRRALPGAPPGKALVAWWRRWTPSAADWLWTAAPHLLHPQRRDA